MLFLRLISTCCCDERVLSTDWHMDIAEQCAFNQRHSERVRQATHTITRSCRRAYTLKRAYTHTHTQTPCGHTAKSIRFIIALANRAAWEGCGASAATTTYCFFTVYCARTHTQSHSQRCPYILRKEPAALDESPIYTYFCMENAQSKREK